MIFMPTLREYYRSMGLSDSKILSLNRELRVVSFSGLTEVVHKQRLDSLNQAKSSVWRHGPEMTSSEITNELSTKFNRMDLWKREITPVYNVNGFEIGVARPGKEAAVDYTNIRHYTHCRCDECVSKGRVEGVNNPHDMFPYVRKNQRLISVRRRKLKDGRVKVTPWTFEHIFSLIEKANSSESVQFALELIGSIMVRIAFMLDHKTNDNGLLFLELPHSTTAEILKRLPMLGDNGEEFPTLALILFLDMLGYNEDVKVDVCGYMDLKRMYAKGLKPQDNGRTNTLLTISHMLAAVLHRRPIGEFAYGLHRGMGMNPMSKGTIVPAYPLLSSNVEDILDVDVRKLNWSP